MPPRSPDPTPPRLGLPRLRAAWRQWWLRRLPHQDQTELTHRNLYILPTRAGAMLGVTLLLLLVGSINYQLNLGYLLTFLLAGCAAVALHVSHRNLRGLQLHIAGVEPVFAGDAAVAHITLHNPSRHARHAVGLGWWAANTPTLGTVWADVAAHDSESVTLTHPTHQRGRHPLPPLCVDTRFPLGTTRAWHWWRPAAEWLVYPAPEPSPPPLPGWAGDDATDTSAPPRPGQGDEMDGVRPYRRGDPLKWVLWKKAARLAEGSQPQWISRDWAQPPGVELWLNAADCGLADVEGQRSRLCAWVLRAEQLGLDHGLRLPGLTLPPDHGPAHQRRCLEALACH